LNDIGSHIYIVMLFLYLAVPLYNSLCVLVPVIEHTWLGWYTSLIIVLCSLYIHEVFHCISSHLCWL